MANGALELSMPEVKVELDKQGRVTGAHVVENTESHQIIEEFMLAANEAVAETLRDRGLHFLRRVHQAPSPQKLQVLTGVHDRIGLQDRRACKAASSCKSCWPPPSGRPEQHAVHFAVLRSLQRAIYSPMEEGHYALASECYCHFTSPIRRYPDLTIHRLVDAILTKTKPRNDYDELVVAGPALLRPRAAGRGRRTRPDQAQAAGLPQRPHRRGDGRRGDRRRELRHLRARHQAAGRRARPRRNASATTTTASTAPRTRWPAIAPATAIGSAICCAWPSPGSIWSAASWISAWSRTKEGQGHPRRARRARRSRKAGRGERKKRAGVASVAQLDLHVLAVHLSGVDGDQSMGIVADRSRIMNYRVVLIETTKGLGQLPGPQGMPFARSNKSRGAGEHPRCDPRVAASEEPRNPSSMSEEEVRCSMPKIPASVRTGHSRSSGSAIGSQARQAYRMSTASHAVIHGTLHPLHNGAIACDATHPGFEASLSQSCPTTSPAAC